MRKDLFACYPSILPCLWSVICQIQDYVSGIFVDLTISSSGYGIQSCILTNASSLLSLSLSVLVGLLGGAGSTAGAYFKGPYSGHLILSYLMRQEKAMLHCDLRMRDGKSLASCDFGLRFLSPKPLLSAGFLAIWLHQRGNR